MRCSLILLAATLGLSSALLFPTNGSCVSATFRSCTVNAFQSFLGVPIDGDVMNVYNDYTILNNFFMRTWGSGGGRIDNIVHACNGLTQFYQCLFGNEYCLSPRNLLSGPSTDVQQMWGVQGVLEDLDFKCGAGLSTIYHGNLACIEDVFFSASDIMAGCYDTYQNNILHDSARACNHRGVLRLCITAPFYKNPCYRPGSINLFYACESANQFGIPQFPACELHCDENGALGQSGAMAEFESYLAEHYKLEADGTHTFIQPDYYQIVDGKKTLVKGRVHKGIRFGTQH